MKKSETPIDGLIVLEPRIFNDERGYFFESYNKKTCENFGITDNFVQDNQSYSSYGTIRGIHFQKGSSAQAKLVRVLVGEVLDVAVDLRPDSNTFGEHFSIKLSAENMKQFYIPRGFGHGFSVLSDHAVFSYKCDNYYDSTNDGGIYFNDKCLGIDWMVPPEKQIVSTKDNTLPLLSDVKETLKWF